MPEAGIHIVHVEDYPAPAGLRRVAQSEIQITVAGMKAREVVCLTSELESEAQGAIEAAGSCHIRDKQGNGAEVFDVHDQGLMYVGQEF